MPKYVVYEVWTRSQIIEAETEDKAYDISAPKPVKGMNLSNWHVVKVEERRRPYIPRGPYGRKK